MDGKWENIDFLGLPKHGAIRMRLQTSQEKIDILNAKIEKMKCCANCKQCYEDQDRLFVCYSKETTKHPCDECEEWELSE